MAAIGIPTIPEDAPSPAPEMRKRMDSATSIGSEGSSNTTAGKDGSAHGGQNFAFLRRQGSSSSFQKQTEITDFAVMGKLGEGGFGQVLLAQHKITGTMVALKVLLKAGIKSDVQAERVLSEAKALGEVSHPFIVTMNGAFQDTTHIFFVLEYVGGGDLFSRLQSDGAIGGEPARIIIAEVALALGHVHQAGYMYRDLKSENVLVCIDGHVKLADFGLAKKFDEKRQERTTRATDGGQRRTMRHSRMVGTPDALAPEVMSIDIALGADRDYGASVDWWGLGILASEVFTGLDSILVASGASDHGRKILTVAYTNDMHLNQPVLGRIAPDERNLICGLLKVDIKNRLGCKEGVKELQEHEYFKSLDFDKVMAKAVDPPLLTNSSILGSTPNAIRKGQQPGQRAERLMSLDKIEQNLMDFFNTPATELCHATSTGDLEKVKALIKTGTDPDSCDYDRRTALHLAASEGQYDVAVYLVEEAGAEHSPLDRWGVRACISLNFISLRALLLTFKLASLSLAHHRGPRSTTRNAKGTRP